MGERRRDEGKEAFWRGVLDRQAQSELSVRAFCRRERLTESAFYAWRQTIRDRDASSANQQSPPAFVPARVTEQSSPAASIAVELASGCVLRLPASIGADRLAELVGALERRGMP